MSDSTRLLKEGKISEFEYRIYTVFALNDVGISLLKNCLDSILMEEPLQPTSELFIWHDGRRSVWRDIKRIIDRVNQQIGAEDDRRSTKRTKARDRDN